MNENSPGRILSDEKISAINEYFRELGSGGYGSYPGLRGPKSQKCEWCDRLKKGGLYKCLHCGRRLKNPGE